MGTGVGVAGLESSVVFCRVGCSVAVELGVTLLVGSVWTAAVIERVTEAAVGSINAMIWASSKPEEQLTIMVAAATRAKTYPTISRKLTSLIVKMKRFMD